MMSFSDLVLSSVWGLLKFLCDEIDDFKTRGY